MKWNVPAKTFLLGEYVALTNGPALLATTTPCFGLSLEKNSEHASIHPDSPAGRFWGETGISCSLNWFDPYHGLGGMGASSAQFLAAYKAHCHAMGKPFHQETMLNVYYHYAWQGKGLKPSGYDVLAQANSGCVYINQRNQELKSFDWPFANLSFLLIHTGKKLATHEHLMTQHLPRDVSSLAAIVETGKRALSEADREAFISAVNDYHHQLSMQNLVAEHTLQLITDFQHDSPFLAAKGCGALGADVLLLLINTGDKEIACDKLQKKGLTILATSKEVFKL